MEYLIEYLKKEWRIIMSPNNLLVVLIITEIFNLVILTVLIAGIKEIVKKQKNVV